MKRGGFRLTPQFFLTLFFFVLFVGALWFGHEWPMIAKLKVGSFTFTREIQTAKPELIVAPPLRLEFNPQQASSLPLSDR